MGRGRGRGGRSGRGGGHGPKRKAKKAFASAEDLDSELFTEYYQKQGVVPEGEWSAFMAALREQLPTTFRINGAGKFAMDLRDKLESDFLSKFTDGTTMGTQQARSCTLSASDIHENLDGEELQPPRPLPWYPNKLGWHMAFTRNQLRKVPVLNQIHELIKRENEAGSITRQEAVSMVPPLFLDVQPHHLVLDMCAAPGSKTAQMMEMLHVDGMQPEGVVVANDADSSRCNLLVHQVQRIRSPALIVTQLDATQYPVVTDHARREPMYFDRILCDVPCSGDGTMRKAPDIWQRWTPGNGNGLHNLQVRIALHACKLVRAGGRVVYSTCTFNPIEDEAVVAEVVRQSKGAVRLLDMSGHMPELKRLPGKLSWHVRDKTGWFDTWEQVQQQAPPQHKMTASMFPAHDAAPSKDIPLQHCMRILPHQQDTGGFFIAVLQKEGPMPRLDQTRFSSAGWQAGQQRAAGGQAAPAQDPAGTGAAQCSAEEPPQHAASAEEPVGMDIDVEASVPVPVLGAVAEAAVEGAQAAALQQRGQQQAAAPGGAGAARLTGSKRAWSEHSEAAGDEGAPSAAGAAPAAAAELGVAVAAAAGVDMDVAAARGALAAEEGQAQLDAPTTAGGASGLPQWGIRGGGGRGREGGGRHATLDPVVPVTSCAELDAIRDFYGVLPEFPLYEQMITRSTEESKGPKRLYFVSAGVKRLLLNDDREALKVQATGLKLFERHDNKENEFDCRYRLHQDGLPLMLPFITQQLLRLTADEFLQLVTERSLVIPWDARDTPAATTEEARGGAAAGAGDGAHAPTILAEQLQPGAATGQAAPAAAAASAATRDEAAAGAKPQAEEAAALQPAAEQPTTAPAAKGKPQADGVQAPAGEGQPRPKRLRKPATDPQTLAQMRRVKLGCCIVMLRESYAESLGLGGSGQAEDALAAHAPMAIAAWRGRGTITVLVSKGECAQIAERMLAAKKRKVAAAEPTGAAPNAAAQVSANGPAAPLAA